MHCRPLARIIALGLAELHDMMTGLLLNLLIIQNACDSSTEAQFPTSLWILSFVYMACALDSKVLADGSKTFLETAFSSRNKGTPLGSHPYMEPE